MLSDKQLLPGPGWRIVERHGVALPGGRVGQEILLASPEGETQLSWWWSRHVEPPCVEILRALLGLDRGLARRPESARLLAVRTDVDPEHPEPARAALKILLALALDDLEKRGEDVW